MVTPFYIYIKGGEIKFGLIEQENLLSMQLNSAGKIVYVTAKADTHYGQVMLVLQFTYIIVYIPTKLLFQA